MSARFVLILPLVFLFSGVLAQGKRKQKKASSPGGTEVFFVNKDNGLRDGPYALVSPSGNTRVSGFYVAGLRYPEDAVNKNQQGKVFIASLVDQQGNPETYEVGVSSGYPALDAEALRVMKLTHQEFIPAMDKGIKVKSNVLQEVNFRLETK